jgi:hypothetical protein
MGNPFKTVKTPTVPEVKIPEATVMPTVDEAEVNKAKKKQIAAASARSGRASTILSADNTTLG